MRVLLIPSASILGEVDAIVRSLERAGVDVTLGAAEDLNGDGGARYDVIASPGTLRCDAELMDRCRRLKGLVSIGVGCEGFDRAAASARSISVATGITGSNAGAIASAAIMLMLALSHDLPGAMAAMGQNRRRNLSRVAPLDDRQVGLIGYGAIGREVSRRLRAWEIEVLVHAPSLAPGVLADGAKSVGLEELLAQADIVSLHASLTPASRNLLDRERMRMMKPGAVLVNTARGGLVDEDALVDALRDGHLSGAALDCFAEEPLPMGHPLRALPNVILTPHQIGHTAAGLEAVTRTLIANIIGMSGAPADPPGGVRS